MDIRISPSVRKKLREKHGVEPKHIEQCFYNRKGIFLTDTREEHRTDPPTYWFLAKTDRNRELKVCFISRGKIVTIKSAFEPNDEEVRIYKKHGLKES